jgi:translation initiation factor 4B
LISLFILLAREREIREDRSAGEWRREAPVPPAGNRFGNDRFGGDRGGDRGDRAPRGDREFGSRFNNSERPPDRTDVNTWRRETPLPAAETTRPGWEKPREREHRDTSWSGGAFTSRAPPGKPRVHLPF